MPTAVRLQEDIQDKPWGYLLYNIIPEDLLLLTDPNGDYYWEKVEEKNIKYFVRQCVGHPWANHFEILTHAQRRSQMQKTKRKEDTSAVTPLLPEIRAEGHLRWNQVSRLREAYRKASADVRENRLPLPMEFHYDESEYVGERWHFILRDLKGFGQFQGEKKSYRDFNDEDCVLELVKAEKLEDGSEGEGPWFIELLRLGLLGNWDTEYITDEHKEKVISYLNH